jgi:hypothetical protein
MISIEVIVIFVASITCCAIFWLLGYSRGKTEAKDETKSIVFPEEDYPWFLRDPNFIILRDPVYQVPKDLLYQRIERPKSMFDHPHWKNPFDDVNDFRPRTISAITSWPRF